MTIPNHIVLIIGLAFLAVMVVAYFAKIVRMTDRIAHEILHCLTWEWHR